MSSTANQRSETRVTKKGTSRFVQKERLPGQCPPTTSLIAGKQKKKKDNHHKVLGVKKEWGGKPRTPEDQLIGGCEESWSSASDEVEHFKKAVKASKTLQEVVSDDARGSFLPTYLVSDPLPADFPTKVFCKVLIKLPSFYEQAWSTTLQLNMNSSFDEFLEHQLIDQIRKRNNDQKQFIEVKASHLVIKAATHQEFLYGNNKISDHEYIRDCVSKGLIPINLTVEEIRRCPDYSCPYDRDMLYKYEDSVDYVHQEITVVGRGSDKTKYTVPVFIEPEIPLPDNFPEKILSKLFFELPTFESTGWATTVQINTKSTVKEFLTDVIYEQMKKRHDKSLNPNMKISDLLLRVRGTDEYIHGDDYLMSDFQIIRQCAAIKGNKIELEVIEMGMFYIEDADASPAGLASGSGSGSANGSSVFGGNVTNPNNNTDKKYKFDRYRKSRASIRESLHDASSKPQTVISVWDIPFVAFSIRINNIVFVPSTKHKQALEEAATAAAAANDAPDSPALTPSANGPVADGSPAFEETLYVRAALYLGNTLICRANETGKAPYNPATGVVTWDQMVTFPLPISDIPRSARILITVFANSVYQQNEPIGFTNIHVFDHKSYMSTGKFVRKLWPGPPEDYLGMTHENTEDKDGFAIEVTMPTFLLPIILPAGKQVKYKARPPTKLLESIINQDSLYELTEGDKFAIWSYRETLKDRAQALPKLIQSVDWTNPTCVCELYKMMEEWKPLDPRESLELLDVTYQDQKVREYAVRRLELLSDKELSGFMIQLVECLKHEAYHFSALACFLLRRAVNSPHLVGHMLFWCLKSEMHNPHVRERFGLILQEYLSTATGHANELKKQMQVVDILWDVAMKIKQVSNKKDRTPALQKLLAEAEKNLPPEFGLPLNPRLECKGIVIEKCKVMSSAKMPLFLVLKNANEGAPDIRIIFKAGDDLKQDILTLQILRIMDDMWKKKGLDLKLIPYGCVATADGVGMIEVVLNSRTMADIAASKGAITGAVATFQDKALHDWVKKHNQSEEEFERAVATFVRSCAGYFVATYCLGIGDRHSDNIMITESGNLFHIDFGHFLGHFKMVGNIERETTPFVFTPMYAAVFGGVNSANYKKLEQLAGEAFNILRKNGNILLTLFKLMRFTGIPELQSTKDIEFLRDRLVLHMAEKDAADQFCALMIESLSNTRQLISDALHVVKHYG